MSFNTDELDRLADEMLRGARLAHSVYCGECGYNLKTLPYLGQCPECGHRYNARPLKMEGVFNPQSLELPIIDGLTVIMLACMGWFLLRGAFSPLQSGSVFLGALTLGVCGAVLSRFISRLRRFLKFRDIESRISSGEDDD